MQPNMIAGSLLEPSLRLSCVYIFIPWPSLGDLAPPVSSRCPTWRSRGADLSLFLSLFSWFRRRFFKKVSFLWRPCVFWDADFSPLSSAESQGSSGEKLWCVCALDALKSQHHFQMPWTPQCPRCHLTQLSYLFSDFCADSSAVCLRYRVKSVAVKVVLVLLKCKCA